MRGVRQNNMLIDGRPRRREAKHLNPSSALTTEPGLTVQIPQDEKQLGLS